MKLDMAHIRNLILFCPMLFPASAGFHLVFSNPDSQVAASPSQQLLVDGLSTDQFKLLAGIADTYRISNSREASDKAANHNLTVTLNAEKKHGFIKDGIISNLKEEKAGLTEDLYKVLDLNKARRLADTKIQEVADKHGRH